MARPDGALLVLHSTGAASGEYWAPRVRDVASIRTVYCEDFIQSDAELRAIQAAGPALGVAVEDDIAAAIRRALVNVPVIGVLTFSEQLLPIAACVAREYGLPHHSVDAVFAMSDKHAQRQALEAGGVPVPRHRVVRNAAELDSCLEHVGVPAVLKPRRGYGSIATYKVESPAHLRATYAEARAVLSADWRVNDRHPDLVLEEYLAGAPMHGDSRMGHMVSVESVCFQGEIHHLTVTDKFPPAVPFRETGDLMPSVLPARVQSEVTAMTTAALTALGATHGACHTELKLTAAGPRIIEVNGRLGGYIAASMERVFEYDIVRELARVAVNEPPLLPTGSAGYVACLNLMAPPLDEVVTDIKGSGRAQMIPGVIRVDLDATGTVPSWRNGGGCYGLVEVTADDPTTLLDRRDEVLQALCFEIGGSRSMPLAEVSRCRVTGVHDASAARPNADGIAKPKPSSPGLH